MTNRQRGLVAALFLSGIAVFSCAPRAAAADVELAPGETILSNGLTTQVRQATASGAVAIEVWIRCPADGWSASQPGIARLTALAVLASKNGGSSLRDVVHSHGGDVNISVFQTATEVAILAPVGDAPALQDELVRRVFHASLDASAFEDARTRLAEEQAAVAQSTVETLRDQVFAVMFSSGPLHDSTFGDVRSLKAMTLDEVRGFAGRSYAAQNAAVVTLGNGNAADLNSRLAASAASMPASENATAFAMPASTVASIPAQPIAVSTMLADVPGVALGWVGPPIADQKAATAMDFLSDYLADQRAGVLVRAALQTDAGAVLAGQFVTLENPGVFFVSVTGENVVPATMEKALRDALRPVTDRPLSRDEFSRALGAYETRLLLQMDSPQGLADNYGWYFAQNAPGYAPSATDATLGGRYFANAASLSADYVHDVARRYLGAEPVVITLVPQPRPINVSTGGM
jgi:predicted Zn-dependent peptidase